MKKAEKTHTSSECHRCGDEAKLRARDFSDQAVATLITHQEISRASVGESMCDPCYAELRDILIDLSQLNDLDSKVENEKLRKSLKRAS